MDQPKRGLMTAWNQLLQWHHYDEWWFIIVAFAVIDVISIFLIFTWETIFTSEPGRKFLIHSSLFPMWHFNFCTIWIWWVLFQSVLVLSLGVSINIRICRVICHYLPCQVFSSEKQFTAIKAEMRQEFLIWASCSTERKKNLITFSSNGKNQDPITQSRVIYRFPFLNSCCFLLPGTYFFMFFFLLIIFRKEKVSPKVVVFAIWLTFRAIKFKTFSVKKMAKSI